jgi:CHRD domain
VTGEQEVPAVKSDGSGSGTISVSADKSISGSVATKGLQGTAAHIHEAAVGKNGGVVHTAHERWRHRFGSGRHSDCAGVREPVEDRNAPQQFL